jgi:hypothetical protein
MDCDITEDKKVDFQYQICTYVPLARLYCGFMIFWKIMKIGFQYRKYRLGQHSALVGELVFRFLP